MVRLQEAELPGGQARGGGHVRVEAQAFVVGEFIASVPLVANCFYCKVGVVKFVHQV